MIKQEFVPRELNISQPYKVCSYDELKKSSNYSLTFDQKEYEIFSTNFFDYVVIVVDELESVKEFKVKINNFNIDPVIGPNVKNLDWSYNNSEFTIKTNQLSKIVIRDKELKQQSLHILFTKKVEKPKQIDYLFKKGNIYNIETLELKSGETVFIEEGAVVCGRFISNKADNIKILGNGILMGSFWHIYYENSAESLINIVQGNNIEINGINLVDGGSWHIIIVSSKDVLIDNINILGCVITGDGIDIVGSEDVKITNSFIRANDDCISIKACDYQDKSGCKNAENILVDNCIFWNSEFGNVLEIGYETRCDEIKNIIFRNCIILYCEYEGNQSGGCLTIHDADHAYVHDVFYENILIENAQEKFVDLKVLDSKYSADKKRGKIENIYFKNITLTGKFPVSIIRGFEMKNELSRPNNINFENIQINGEKVLSANQLRMVVELTDLIKFKG